ncbi:MAG: hypothetical protein H6718_09805 [Polyangiaceae bacterium]|nr:hypothetical protein [Myxococcales bacterium]MCB9585683.1 hypothetical protein [Polyangiaceae bacterium]MCB9607388.1 hypothetical protein [Polyangiaceae bacterium]
MRRFSLALTLLITPFFVGCSSDDCTDLGCGGLQFDLSVGAAAATPSTVRICQVDTCSDVALTEVSTGVWRGENSKFHVEWQEASAGVKLSGYTYGSLPDVESELWGFEVTADDGSQIFQQKFNVTYEPVELNGPGCGVCNGGVIET